MILVNGKVSRMRPAANGMPVGEYLVTTMELDEEKGWTGLGRDELKGAVLARFAEEQAWSGDAGEAVIFPYVMADELVRHFHGLDPACNYFALVCSNEQLRAERERRVRNREAVTESSFTRHRRLSPEECFERLEKQHLA